MKFQTIIFLSLGFFCHLYFAAKGTIKILNAITLSNRRKQINIILLWLFPFVWYSLIKIVLKPIPGSHEVPIKNDVSSNNFDESGLGAPGTGIGNRNKF